MTAKIIRPLTGRIQVRGLRGPRDGEPTNKEMFKDAAGAAIRPTWVKAAEEQPYWMGYWTISRKHLTDVAETIAVRDGRVELEMHYSQTEQCDRRCQSAEGDDCTCACEGRYHGNSQHASWIDVGDTTLVRGDGPKVVNRVLNREQAIADRDERLENLVKKLAGD